MVRSHTIVNARLFTSFCRTGLFLVAHVLMYPLRYLLKNEFRPFIALRAMCMLKTAEWWFTHCLPIRERSPLGLAQLAADQLGTLSSQ